jgi:hypothetical protein
MATTQLTAGNVMDRVASLLNDTAQTIFTYTAQIPYLNMAYHELEEEYQLANIPITNETSAVVNVAVGQTQLNPTAGYAPNTAPNYPDDLIEAQQLWERLQGSSDPFVPMKQYEFLPHTMDPIPSDSLLFWIWQDQRIFFNPSGALTAREVKIDYIKAIFLTELVNQNSAIDVINARSFLQYRTAALCAEFIGENKERAASLNESAIMSLDRALGIGIKGKQAITTRRRPFRASYRSRGIW